MSSTPWCEAHNTCWWRCPEGWCPRWSWGTPRACRIDEWEHAVSPTVAQTSTRGSMDHPCNTKKNFSFTFNIRNQSQHTFSFSHSAHTGPIIFPVTSCAFHDWPTIQHNTRITINTVGPNATTHTNAAHSWLQRFVTVPVLTPSKRLYPVETKICNMWVLTLLLSSLSAQQVLP